MRSKILGALATFVPEDSLKYSHSRDDKSWFTIQANSVHKALQKLFDRHFAWQ